MLKVIGVGEVSKPVDFLVVSFMLQSEDYDYQEVLRKLNLKLRALRESINKAGFNDNDLKTLNYKIEPRYQYQDGRSVFNGYRGTHDLVLEFAYDKERLNRLFTSLLTSNVDALFSLDFTVKESQRLKDEAIKEAINNAFHNANLIASSANIKLGKILNIIYDEPRAIPYPRLRIEAMSYAPKNSLDVVPSEVKETATVHIEFEIILK